VPGNAVLGLTRCIAGWRSCGAFSPVLTLEVIFDSAGVVVSGAGGLLFLAADKKTLTLDHIAQRKM